MITPMQWKNHFRHVCKEDDANSYAVHAVIEVEKLDGQISLEETKQAIMSLKNGKACGEDGIPPEFYKQLIELPQLLLLLTEIHQKIFEEGIVPQNWGIGMIYLIYKGKGA